MLKQVNLIFCCIAGLVFAGCNDSVSVSGSVIYRGQAVEDGVVQFVPVSGLPVSAELTSGTYRIDGGGGLKPGAYIVKLYGYRETGRMLRNPDDPTQEEPEVVEVLPPAYNQSSEIEVELAAGENSKDFDLE